MQLIAAMRQFHIFKAGAVQTHSYVRFRHSLHVNIWLKHRPYEKNTILYMYLNSRF